MPVDWSDTLEISLLGTGRGVLFHHSGKPPQGREKGIAISSFYFGKRLGRLCGEWIGG